MARGKPPHSDAAQAAITAELVRLTLPHRGERRELQVRRRTLLRLGR